MSLPKPTTPPAEAWENSPLAAFVRDRARRWGKDTIRHVEPLVATAAQFGAFPASLDPRVVDALRDQGMEAPYTHQATAWEALAGGQSIVVTTPTASGKSLCYTVPVLQMLLADPDGTALLIYPTKALAQDQCAALNRLLQAAGIDEPAQIYDGDTPAELRRRIRDTARVVLTNPDMLHASILPHQEKWRRLFVALRYVVVDEMHTYRGVFGSHVANVLRRLWRVAAHVGATPQAVLTSATIANPVELASQLVGHEVVGVHTSGAPTGPRGFVLVNPPILDALLKRRRAASTQARMLAQDLLEAGHSVIVFARSRQGVEIMVRTLREQLVKRRRADLADAVEGYRGGYLPEDRRRIERGLREGTILGVVSTNALELGVDIGALDACVIAGYPGTIASTWQQAGRAGRRQKAAATFLVASEDPVDQFLVQNPAYFFDAQAEHGRIEPNNLRILAEHLKCAVFELPFPQDAAWPGWAVDDSQEVLAWLADTGFFHAVEGAWRWQGDAYPATAVNLRDILSENFVIIETSRNPNEILGEIDFESAHTTVYEQAIYQHGGLLHEVHRLDYDDRKAWVRRVESEYYTQAIDQTRVFVLDVTEEGVSPPRKIMSGHGEIRRVQRFVGYKKIRHRTGENIGYGEIHLPDLELHTTAWWVTFDHKQLRTLGLGEAALAGGLNGVAALLHTVAQVLLMCARGDLVVTVQGRDGAAWDLDAAYVAMRAEGPASPAPRPTPTTLGTTTPLESGAALERPSIFLYDRTPGGVGFSERLHERHADLLQQALALVDRCPCETGCPLCVGPEEFVTRLGKVAARALLRHALG